MRYARLIYKLNKGGKTYYLWNVGSYKYELTDFNSEIVAEFLEHDLDEVLTACRHQGYILINIE